MLFYKIYGETITIDSGDEEKRVKREMAHSIATKTAEFNEIGKKSYCFLCEMKDEYATLGLIVDVPCNLVELTKSYVKFIGLDVTVGCPEEITLANMQSLLCCANRHSYVEDDDEILERFGLDKLSGRRGLEFGENLVNHKAKKDALFASAKKYYMDETLIPELERIYAGGKSLDASGHPVHYIVETDDRDTRREVYKIILDALFCNLRLKSCRYSFLDFVPTSRYSHMAYESLYKVSEGGAVVVRYLADDDSEDDSFAANEEDTIANICDMARRYRNKVLTILCFPRECKRIKARFYESLGTMSFIEVREDFIDSITAKRHLGELARRNHVRADKKLFSGIKDTQTYLAPELQAIFDEWYNGKLKSTVYPQYKDVAAVRKDTLKAKPQGMAYDELAEMIGLSEAKDVIKKALNYYKMQKLYEEKGVKRDNPAMHMIFTGNPGTAKTTVARLFSRIMRENGLLSKGQLVEVGRGGLVGKYTGWTAQTVQAKFAEASGGVLFIDEAYSLVDDRNGSFGDEAINTIVQEMENHRADVVVIFAGYPDKMEEFLAKNPSLRSRIAFHVPFADYTSAELCKIAEHLSKKNGMKIDEEAIGKLEKAFDAARATTDFGNGRYVRNLFEQAKMNQASRLLEKDLESISSDDITTITADDIVIPDAKKGVSRRIGFC